MKLPRPNTSDLIAHGPDSQARTLPNGVCGCCKVYYPTDAMREEHEREKRARHDPFGKEFIDMLMDIGGLKGV